MSNVANLDPTTPTSPRRTSAPRHPWWRSHRRAAEATLKAAYECDDPELALCGAVLHMQDAQTTYTMRASALFETIRRASGMLTDNLDAWFRFKSSNRVVSPQMGAIAANYNAALLECLDDLQEAVDVATNLAMAGPEGAEEESRAVGR